MGKERDGMGRDGKERKRIEIRIGIGNGKKGIGYM